MGAEDQMDGYWAIRNGDPYASSPSNSRRNPLSKDYDFDYDHGCKIAEGEIAAEKERDHEIAEHNRLIDERHRNESQSSEEPSSDNSSGCGCLIIIIILLVVWKVPSCREEVKTDHTPQRPSTPIYTPPSTTSGGVASLPVAPEWPRPKDWFYNECNIIERNVQHYTGGGYRYDRSSARQVSSQVSTLRTQLSRNDVNGSVRAYNELKQVYNSFVNGCQWQANMRHPRYNHAVSSYTPNRWEAENGWEFVNPGTSDFSVRRKPVQVRCDACRGHGYVVQKTRCHSCNGRGRVPNPAAQIGQAVNVVGGIFGALGGRGGRRGPVPRVPQAPAEIRCPSCSGTGNQQQNVRCNKCMGNGMIYKTQR